MQQTQSSQVAYLVKQCIKQWHVLRLGFDGVREEHVGLVRDQVGDGRLLHTCKGCMGEIKYCGRIISTPPRSTHQESPLAVLYLQCCVS